jgi:hypothetical protein
MAKKIIGIFFAVISALAVFISLQPSDFQVSRSAEISAPAAVIFPHINNFKNWQKWSPWAPLDPQAIVEFNGPESGKDAYIRWSGNMEIGTGSMQIIDSRENDFINLKLDMEKPIKANNFVEFSLKQEGDKTTVKWEMYGKKNFVGKLMGFIFNCEKIVGTQFETGLENLKLISEKR